MSLERIWPTKENLLNYLKDYPEHQLRYDLISTHVSGLHCADVSCGVGYGSYLIGQSAKSVKGFDISEEALEHANKHFTDKNVSFNHLKELKNQQFEFISSVETLEHMSESDGDEFLKMLRNAMLPDSVLFITTPLNNSSFKENVTEFHIREYSGKEFREKLTNNGFCIEKIFGISNITSQRMSHKVMGISILNIFKTKIHRLIPKSLRKIIARWLLKKDSSEVSLSCRIHEDSLEGAFCQMAICKPLKIK